MPKELTNLLGERHGRPYFLLVRVEPDFERVREFAALIYYNDPFEEKPVEVARIDTAHGFTHFDKLYRRDQPKEPVDLDVWGAIDHLDTNWRRYADSYDDAHSD